MDELQRVLELAGVSRTDEIIKVPPLGDSGIDGDFDTSNRKRVFDVDGYPVYLDNVGHQDIYTIMDGDEVVYQSVYDNVSMPQYKSVYIGTRGYMNPKYRGKGIALKTLVDVKKFSNKVIISDERLTDDGYNFWIKILDILPVKIINLNTGEVMPVTGNEDVIVQKTKNDERYSFIIETDILSGGRVVESNSIYKSFDYILIEADPELMNL